MTGVRNDPEIGLRDIFRDEDGMSHGDELMVTSNDQGGALNGMQLVEGHVWLI